MTETVKVQRPLFPPDGPWLIYGRNHKHSREVPHFLIPDYVKKAMGDDKKAYFVGAWSSIVGWGLSSRVKDEDW
jgi:hypothetical protein